MTDIQSHAAIAAYRNYIARYPAAVLRALKTGGSFSLSPLAAWSFPLLILSKGNILFVEQEPFERAFLERYRGYIERGWSGDVRIDSVEAQSIGEGLVWLQATGARYDRDGHILERWDSGYMMRNADGGWRTIMLTDAPRPRPDGEDWARWVRLAIG